jgi:hypothetical protein
MREFKLNGMDAWIIPSKHVVKYKMWKDNYSLSLKSMSMTISPFLIIFTMTHMMELVSSAASVSITWDMISILVTLTFSPIYTWLENIYVYANLWDGRVLVLMDLECSGTLGSSMYFFFSCGSLPEGRNDICCHVLFHNSIEQG